jgi:hypothetical protein
VTRMGHFARRDADPTAYPQVTRLAQRRHGYATVADGQTSNYVIDTGGRR